MRNVLIHEYFTVDLNLVWGTVKDEVPNLKKRMDVITNEVSEQSSRILGSEGDLDGG